MARRERYTREQIIERDHGVCWICGIKIDLELKHPHPLSLTIDHVVPLSRGGQNVARNVALAHQACNEAKSNLMPWEFLNLPEGVLYHKDGRTALLILTNNDQDLYYILNKIGRTRIKWLKNLVKNIKIYLN